MAVMVKKKPTTGFPFQNQTFCRGARPQVRPTRRDSPPSSLDLILMLVSVHGLLLPCKREPHAHLCIGAVGGKVSDGPEL